MHLSGKLLATRKKDFHKLYDLTDNIVPAHVDKPPPTVEEFCRHSITRSLRALGLAYANEIAWNSRLVKYPINTELKKMVESNEVCEVSVTGLKGPLYMLRLYKEKKIKINSDVFILSPFDTLNVFRRRLRDFFNFDYQVECFVPQPKRKFGYFSLPILVGDTFVARMDAKAERKLKTLIIHNIHFEQVTITKLMTVKICHAIEKFQLLAGAPTSLSKSRMTKNSYNNFEISWSEILPVVRLKDFTSSFSMTWPLY